MVCSAPFHSWGRVMKYFTRITRIRILAVLALLAIGCAFAFAPVSLAQAIQPGSQPVVGSSLVATADPAVVRPNTRHCEVTLLTNQAFDDFNNKDFTFTPPAACRGPWAKVIFTGDFSIQPGVQFDRTGQLFFGGVNIYFGTTAEPLATETDTWHVERDLTDYSTLFTTAQTGYASLGNIVGADGLNSIIFGTFKLEFYEADFLNPAPRTADEVLPVQQGGNSSFQITSSNTQVVQSFTLPKNVESAYLDVVAQSQNAEEQWFFCVPTDIAAQLDDCQNTAFREVEISVDGKPAGAAPVYPWIYTGGLDPGLWVPIPGVQTLNLLPYRVDLTPFAGTLNDGQPHTVGVSVFNAYSYFTVTAQLLVFEDHGSRAVTGEVTENTLTAPNPTVTNTVTLDANDLVTQREVVTTTNTGKLHDQRVREYFAWAGDDQGRAAVEFQERGEYHQLGDGLYSGQREHFDDPREDHHFRRAAVHHQGNGFFVSDHGEPGRRGAGQRQHHAANLDRPEIRAGRNRYAAGFSDFQKQRDE